jgi:DNA repair protein RecO (recombination protein O)
MARSTHTYSTQAIVLRNRNLGEKDRIMTLLSPEIGKFCAVAKGSRAPKSKLAAVSQPFTFARFLVARGRSLDIATQAEVEQAHTHIAGDLLRTAWATYLCELCDFVPEHQPDEELFDTLRLALERLNVFAAPKSLWRRMSHRGRCRFPLRWAERYVPRARRVTRHAPHSWPKHCALCTVWSGQYNHHRRKT